MGGLSMNDKDDKAGYFRIGDGIIDCERLEFKYLSASIYL
jgi:hypothetical protein